MSTSEPCRPVVTLSVLLGRLEVVGVRSSVEIQRSMAEQNAAVPQDQRIEFRIGIHVGDVIFDDNDIFGDGVNIAARLEGIAEPGGVCMSDDAYRQVRGKVEIT